ncbi:MAG: pre-peptidase C-terminal domain-containing protein [Gammaproteobacteria bacterium]|nr:pre-peptidase C-terminal domain-containing protein [Gammaproteobacteria bacterium]
MRNFKHKLLAVMFGTVVTLPAIAGGPLGLNPNDPDNFERWPNGGVNIPYQPDQGGLGSLSNAEATALVDTAYQVWEDVPTATATYSNNGQMPFDITVDNYFPFVTNLFFGENVSDGFSPIAFDEDGSIFVDLFGVSGVLGFASSDTFDANGVPIEAVSFLNGGSILNGFPKADFYGVMVHEFGHYSGMAHTVVNGQNVALGDTSGPTPNNTYGNAPLDQVETMYPFAIPDGGAETLHADDIAFYSTMYPEPGWFAGSGTFSGMVLAPNGTTPITGVNVIARNVDNPFVDAVSAISGDRGVTGEYTFNGLTPGAEYTVHIDQILDGGFSTTPVALIGPEEFYNGANESTDPGIDDPSESVNLMASAGATVSGLDVIFNSFGPGDPLPVGDDGSIELFMPFAFEICGQSFDSVFINANGNVTFGAAEGFFIESVGGMLAGPPRIAGLWDDLNPSAGGTVTFDQDKNSFTAIWDDVPEFFSTGSNSFAITMQRANNGIDIVYGDISSLDGLAGVSCGGAVTSGFEEGSDLSQLQADADPGRINLHNSPAVFELFPFGSNDLDNSYLLFNGTTNYNDNWAGKNDTPRKARSLNLPFSSVDVKRFTEIEPAGGDIDWFRFRTTGQFILDIEIIGGQLDSLIALFDSSGNLVAADDDGGAGLLSKISAFGLSQGTYFLAVTTFPDFGLTGAGGSGGRYVLNIEETDTLDVSPGDEASALVPLPFSFPFQGGSFDSVWVNDNGYLMFGAPPPAFSFSPNVPEFLGDFPRIAGLWQDMDTGAGGQLVVTGDASHITFSWENVPEWLTGNSNTFSITLNDNGTYHVTHGAVDAISGIVGTTEGFGAIDPGETDLSAGGPFPAAGTTYEDFFLDLDLDGLTLDFDQ